MKKNNDKKISDKILIVEDDKDFLDILKIKFESEGFSVVTAESGLEGINVCEQQKPILILSDVLMPETSGIEMAKKIRSTNKDVIIMFMTNLKDIDYVKEIKDCKEFDCIIKSDTRIGEIVEKVKSKLKKG